MSTLSVTLVYCLAGMWCVAYVTNPINTRRAVGG
jgi:hypothetical protein